MAGFINKLINSMKLNDDEDEFEPDDEFDLDYDDEEEEEDCSQTTAQKVKKKKVTVTFPMIDYEGKNYMIVESLYRKAGFLNIEMVPMKDLNSLTVRKNGMVAQITIDGDEEIEEDSKYSENARVIITYHSR